VPHFSNQLACIRPAGLPVKQIPLVVEQYRSRHHANAVMAGRLATRTHQQIEVDDFD
jgi:hypothetical protein